LIYGHEALFLSDNLLDMKKIISFLIFLSLTLSTFAQKARKPAKSSSKSTLIAKADNVSAVLLETKGAVPFFLLVNKAGKTDSLLVKTFIDKKVIPSEGKLTSFTANGDKLYLLTWTEKSETGDAKTKIEKATETHSEIWSAESKKMLHSNVGKVVNITEIVWLDPNKTASKTQDRIRREGFELSLSPEGDIILKNKTQQDRMTYDAVEKKYVAVKSAPSAQKKKK
jgi:hypothetical protein